MKLSEKIKDVVKKPDPPSVKINIAIQAFNMFKCPKCSGSFATVSVGDVVGGGLSCPYCNESHTNDLHRRVKVEQCK